MANDNQLRLNLYTEIERAIFFEEPVRERGFLTLMNPGMFIDPSYDESKVNDLFNQSFLLDPAVQASFLYKEAATGTISSIYNDVLTQTIRPQKTLTASEETEIQDLTTKIASLQTLYNGYKDESNKASSAYYDELAKSEPNENLLRRLRRDMNDAMNVWKTVGRKDEYDRANARIQYLNSRDPNIYWLNLQQTFANSVRTNTAGADFFPTTLLPPVKNWSGAGWSSFEYELDDSNSSSNSTSTSWGGSGSFGFGLWSVGASASGSTYDRSTRSDTSKLKVKFEYRRVALVRPWLKENTFALRSWAFDPEVFGNRVLSDGKHLVTGGGVAPSGDLPLITAYALVVRNVEITASFGSDDERISQTTFKSSASIGWGCFKLSGGYERSTSARDASQRFENGKITIPDPQIIGYFCRLLPLCPSPDLTLNWERNPVKRFDEEILQYQIMASAENRAQYEVFAERDAVESKVARENKQKIEDLTRNMPLKEEELKKIFSDKYFNGKG